MLLGVDIGGTGCKTLLLSEEGAVVACASRAYALRHPRPGWAEIDPDEWWKAFLNNLKDLSRLIDLGAVHAIGVSCTNALLGLDAAGNVVLPAVMFMDQRSIAVCHEMQARVPQDVLLKTTGNRLMPGTCAASTVFWAARERPQLYARIWKFMAPSAYFVYRLTGELAMDRSRATPTALFDLWLDDWSSVICGAWDIDPGRFPAVHDSWAVVGHLTDAAARETGLDASVAVVTGGTDSSCAALGAGVVAPGAACEVSGTATVLLANVSRPVPDLRFMTIHHVVRGQWLAVAPMSSVGSALRWFRDTFCADAVAAGGGNESDAYDLLCEEASQSPPGANRLVFLPYLCGERAPIWDPHAGGVFFGSELLHTRHDFLRALLESAGYGLKWNIEVLEERGIPVANVHCVGGQSRSEFWVQLKADITQRPYRLLACHDASALGAAILAGQGIGVYPDPIQASLSINRVRKEITPRPGFQETYARNAALSRRLYSQIKELFRQGN